MGRGARRSAGRSGPGWPRSGSCSWRGNLEGARLLIADGGPLRDYDWFAPSRVIPDTITEFPWFSFLLGDLHAHVLALPFTLLALAFALQVVLAGPRLAGRGRALLEGGAAALAIGFLYAVNSWSYPVHGGAARARRGRLAARPAERADARPAAVRWLLAVLAGSVLLVLPFHLIVRPGRARASASSRRGAASRAGCATRLLCSARSPRSSRVAYAGRLLATRRPVRNAVWIAVAALFAGSLLAALDYAHVGAARRAAGASRSARCCRSGRRPPQRLVWLLAAGGVACVLGPELLYIRDEFDGSALYRMNTVFKLDYQAWLLLGLAGIGALAWWRRVAAARGGALGLRGARRRARSPAPPSTRSRARTPARAASPAPRRSTASAGCATARRATSARSSGSTTTRRRARSCSRRSATTTRRSATRASRRSPGCRPCSAGRATSASGATTVGDRAAEVDQAYTSPTAAAARAVLDRYDVRYVVVGPLERTDYGDAGVAKWDQLGERVFDARRHDRVGDPPPPERRRRPGARRATPACRRSGSTARAR